MDTFVIGNRTIEVEKMKNCILSSGYRIALFRVINPVTAKLTCRYIVALKRRAIEKQYRFFEPANAINCYLEMICRYA